MGLGISFQGRCRVEMTTIDAAKKAVFESLKNELPENAHRADVFQYVLETCKNDLFTKIIKL